MNEIFGLAINNPFTQLDRVFIYGAGNQCKTCVQYFESLGKSIIISDGDEKKQGKLFANKYLILAPKELKMQMKSEDILVIGAINHQYEIAQELVNMYSIKEEKIYSYTDEWYENRIYLNEEIISNQENIEKCYNSFEDDDSKRYYLGALKGRLGRNPFYFVPNPKIKRVGIYDNDTVTYRKNDTIVDCGAYIGDTAKMYFDTLDGQCIIYAFEPFQSSFMEMVDNTKKYHMEEKVKCYNVAVGAKEDKTNITYSLDTFPMSISLDNEIGECQQVIEVDSLDNLLKGIPIDYIKFDIEGEELNALKGAKDILIKYHPDLMISAYHKIEDFWEIPLYLKTICPEYRIYVGHAPGVSTEMEYYCTIR